MAPRRFEIPGIRSWRPARRGAEGRHVAADGATPGPGDADLTGVLDRWDRQLAKEAKEQRAADDRKERFREDAGRLLWTLIAPTLDAIGEQIGARGHGWSVEERIDIQTQPAIACSFRPASANGKRRPASEVCFRFQFPGRLAVTGAVAWERALEDFPARSYSVGELDAELVKREVARLISAALENG